MAIKIIKRGEPPPEPKYRGTCRTCGSEVECRKDDLTGTEYDGAHYNSTIDCPVYSKCQPIVMHPVPPHLDTLQPTES